MEPYYILSSHSPISTSSHGAPSQALGHPIIQYHYANDSPLALTPQSANEHVLILDYDPASTSPPTVRSISRDLAVSSLKVEEAPGAAAASDNNLKNDRMYIIGTTSSLDEVPDMHSSDPRSATAILDQFKQRNTLLRRVLAYPESHTLT